jgi:hypothetical protein
MTVGGKDSETHCELGGGVLVIRCRPEREGAVKGWTAAGRSSDELGLVSSRHRFEPRGSAEDAA